jgi:hypothetical protein
MNATCKVICQTIATLLTIGNSHPLVVRHSIFGNPMQLATPLSHAISYKDWWFVEWLLDHGADPDKRPPRRDEEDRYSYYYDDENQADSTVVIDQLEKKFQKLVVKWKTKRAHESDDAALENSGE